MHGFVEAYPRARPAIASPPCPYRSLTKAATSMENLYGGIHRSGQVHP